MTQLESASKKQTAQYRAPRPRLHLPKNNSHELIRCNGDVNVTVINSKTKINGCKRIPGGRYAESTGVTKSGTRKTWNGNIQTNVRTNNSEQWEGIARENVGFRDQKGRKAHPNFAMNIAMEFHDHTFCAPNKKNGEASIWRSGHPNM